MLTLSIILGSLGYIGTGYWLAMVANKLYMDERPNSELTWREKLKRLIFFPYSYVNGWHAYDQHNCGLRKMLKAEFPWKKVVVNGWSKDQRVPEIDPANLRNYNTVHSLVWGLKLTHLVPVTLILLWKGFLTITGAIERRFHSTFPSLRIEAPQVALDELGEIKQFIENELAPKITTLQAQADKATDQCKQMQDQLDRWAAIREKMTDIKMVDERFGQRERELKQLLARIKDTEVRSRTALEVLAPLQADLALNVQILEEHARTDQLVSEIDPEIALEHHIDNTLKATQALMDACRKVYDLEAKHLAGDTNADPTPLANQMLEGDRVQDRLRETYLNGASQTVVLANS